MTQQNDPLIGQVINGFKIMKRIGRGGMSRVYLAHQLSTERDVAFKVMLEHYAESDHRLRRFQREARILVSLDHPHIIPVYDFGEHAGRPYIAMRYLPGGSLDNLLSSKQPLPTATLLDLLNQIVPALDYAHEHGVVHRDLKPGNVLLDGRGNYFLTDFGIAHATSPDFSSMGTKGPIGTPAYMAPEQITGDGIDHRADIYALGVMLYQMTSGALPFTGDSAYQVAVRHITELPQSPQVANPTISDAVAAIILRAIAKEPNDRYDSAGALWAALAASFEDDDITPEARVILQAMRPRTSENTNPTGAQPTVKRAPRRTRQASASAPIASPAPVRDAAAAPTPRPARRGVFFAGLGVLISVLLLVGVVMAMRRAPAPAIAAPEFRVLADETPINAWLDFSMTTSAFRENRLNFVECDAQSMGGRLLLNNGIAAPTRVVDFFASTIIIEGTGANEDFTTQATIARNTALGVNTWLVELSEVPQAAQYVVFVQNRNAEAISQSVAVSFDGSCASNLAQVDFILTRELPALPGIGPLG